MTDGVVDVDVDVTGKVDDTSGDLSLFYLVTGISLYSALIPTIVSLLVNLFIWDCPVETSLLRQVSDLKEELGLISMTDEFAKYSKIKRKLNKASDELNSKSRNQMIKLSKLKLVLYVVFYLILVVCTVTVNWRYKYEPIFTFPENALYPIGLVVGFPTGQSNCLSPFTWTLITGYLFRQYVPKLTKMCQQM